MPNSTFEFFGPNGGAGSTPDIRNKNKLVNQEVDAVGAGNPGKVMELVGEASTIAGAAGTVDGIHEAFKSVDERWNPQMYAQRSVDAMAATGIDLNPATTLPAFEAAVVQPARVAGRTKTPENPAAVKIAARDMLAGRHVDNMGTDIDVVDSDAYIAANRMIPGGVVGNPAQVRIDANLEQQITAKAEAKRQARISQVTADFQAGRITRADVEAIINKPGVNLKIKGELEKVIAPAKKEEQTKTNAGAEALALKNLTPDQIAARMRLTPAYTGASAEVKAAIDAQLAVNKTSREIAKENEVIDESMNRIAKWEDTVNYWKGLAKEWKGRIKIMLKVGLPVALIFAVGGPAMAAMALSGSGLALSGVGVGVIAGVGGASGLLLGGTVGGALSGLSSEVIKSEKEKLLAQKALKEAEKRTPELEAEKKRRKLTEKVTAIQQYAQVYAQGNGYDAGLVAKEILKGTNTDGVEALLKAIS